MKKISWVATFLFLSAFSAFAQKADLILINGKVWTAESAEKTVAAVAIKGEKIIEAGTDRAIARFRGPTTKVIDLGGKFAMSWL
jgi:predicted amidohydrolase YtcJ